MRNQSRAIKLLEEELKHLQAHGESPRAQAVIQRMIHRHLELREVLDKMLRYPNDTRSEESQQDEQKKLIWVIAYAAADTEVNPQSASAATSLREGRVALREQLNQLAKQAEKLAATIDAINTLCEVNGMQLPIRQVFDALALLQRTAFHSGRCRAYGLSDALATIPEHYWECMPSLGDLLQELAQTARADAAAPIEGHYWLELGRRTFPVHDFIRTLIHRIDRLPPFLDFDRLGWNAEDLLNLAVVCLDLDDEDVTLRGINQLLQERRERNASKPPRD